MTGEKDKFFPMGAIAFFALLVLFYSVFWLAMYELMISRN
jgi:hypothetical protein